MFHDKNHTLSRRPVIALCCCLVWLLAAGPVVAQFADDPPSEGVSLGESSVRKYQIGVRVKASKGACKALRATLPIPIDWPEQTVRVVEEDISPRVRRVGERKLTDTVTQMTVEIPMLSKGQEAHALRTYEITRRAILAPEDTSRFKIPTKRDHKLMIYLGTSPYIETRHPKIRKQAVEVFEENSDKTDWQKVEAIYDYVRKTVRYEFSKDIKGAYEALRDGVGDCEELSSLFIAFCRVNKIPARLVWVPDHCYAEFYLEDAEGGGHWFPCELAGARSFGEMSQPRPILQKGDNINVPEKGHQRYVSEHLRGYPARKGGGEPEYEFIRKMLD